MRATATPNRTAAPRRFAAFALALSLFMAAGAGFAQEAPLEAPAAPPKPPVMKSVFWNTLMGSAWGALIGVSAALSDPTVNFRESLIFGTTLGGLTGYGFGVYLVIRGLSFDPNVIPIGNTTPFAGLDRGVEGGGWAAGGAAAPWTAAGGAAGGPAPLAYADDTRRLIEGDLERAPFRLVLDRGPDRVGLGVEATVYDYRF